jgi:S-adenosylmethionine uptake transporter
LARVNRVPQHPVLAFAVALSAVATLSVMDALMKALVIALGIYVVSVWRSLATLAISASLYLPHRLPWPSRKTLHLHVGRGAVVMVMAWLFFWGIGRVPLAQGIALTFIAPLLALLLAAVSLGETISARSIVGSVAAFAGVVIIVVGQAKAQLGPGVLIGSIAIIGSALCYAVNIVLMRHQALAAKPLEISFFQSLVVTLLWLAVVPFVGLPVVPNVSWWAWIALAAAMSVTGGLLFAYAYARAQAGYLAVTEYSAFVWASALGWLVFHERVGPFTLAGALLIVAGCVVASRGRRQIGPEIEIAA